MTEGTRVGTVIEDKYRLDEQIGRGSMGAVYRGTQLMVDRSVAIKLLHPTFAGHDKIQARFEVEAKAIARLSHPNCITLFDFGYSQGLEAFYTVVEFIDGTSLADLIEQRPPIARVVNLIKQIASALGHAHHHGILHRDLKPENIMIAPMTDGSDIIKVLDFGIAQIMKGNADDSGDDFDDSDRLTRVGEVFGTPPYMSPEQAQSSRDLTPAADLYSLGVIFYELLEGRLPFFADAPVEILRMHMSEAPPPMKRRGLPKAVEDVVMQMLAKDPSDRPTSGNEIVTLLDAISDDVLSQKAPVAVAEGSARPEEPTLMQAPPESDEFPAPGDASEIFELTDLAAGAEALNASKAPADRPSTKIKIADSPGAARSPKQAAEPAAQDREKLVATQFLDDDDAALDSEVSSLNRAQFKTIASGVLLILLCLGGLGWLIVTYNPFGFTAEDRLDSVGEVAAEHHGDSAPAADEKDHNTSDAPDLPNRPAERDNDADDAEAAVVDIGEDSGDAGADADSESDAPSAAEAEADPEPAPRPPRRQAPSPTPAEEEAQPEEERRPVRLGGTRSIRGVSGDGDDSDQD